MPRDILALLWDVDTSAAAIMRYTAGVDEEAFYSDEKTQDAVERRFITIGEALNRIEGRSPEVAARIPALRKAVGMRNRLTHEYPTIELETVWEAALHSVPELKRAIGSLIDELTGSEAGTSIETPASAQGTAEQERKDKDDWRPPAPSPFDKTDGTTE